MHDHNPATAPRRRLAIAGALIAGGLSILLLVEPNLHAGWTLDVLVKVVTAAGFVVLATVIGIIAHGNGNTPAGWTLATLALVGSLLIVVEQAKRRAQVRDLGQQTATESTMDRQGIRAELASIAKTLAYAEPDQKRECLDAPSPLPPKGWPECRRKTGTVTALKERRERLEAKLQALPIVVSDPLADRVAKAATLSGYSAELAREWVVLLDPISAPAWLELASIALGIVAFAGRGAAGTEAPAGPKHDDRRPRNSDPPPHRPSSPSRGPFTRIEAERDLCMTLALGKPVPPQEELARRWGRTEGCVSKWCQSWERSGLISRTKVGRLVATRLAAPPSADRKVSACGKAFHRTAGNVGKLSSREPAPSTLSSA